MPAFSWASRAALSVASCAGSSLGTNGVLAFGVGVGVAAVVAAAAPIVVIPYRIAPVTPPTSIDPAMAAAVTVLRTPIMSSLLRTYSLLERWVREGPRSLRGWCAFAVKLP